MAKDNMFRQADPITRRNFMSGAAKSLLGLGAFSCLPNEMLLAGQDSLLAGSALLPATAKNVIYLYMSGGMSHIDTFDTKPGSEVQGPIKSISTNADGIQIGEHFPLLARHMDKVAVINSMHTSEGAHNQGRYLLHTSYDLRGTIKHPSMGAWLSKMGGKLNTSLPGHVAIGGGQYTADGGFFGSQHGPLPIGDPTKGLSNSKRAAKVSNKAMARRLERLEKMNKEFRRKHGGQDVTAYDAVYDEALRLMKSSDLKAFDISQEDDAVRDAYGRDRFGQGCLLARRLVEHNVRFVEVVLGGWDTHNDNFEAMEEKCPVLDRALASLLADLDARGLLEETLVVLGTEFGRTPEVSAARKGRDHFPKAFSCLLAGGGIKGGMSWGKTDERGANIIENAVAVQDFNATIAHALGLPVDQQLYSPSGRPFQVAHKGKIIHELFA